MFRFILLSIFCLSLPACSAKPGGSVTLTSLQSGQTFTQPFSRAYLSQSELGDFDIVLIDDQISQTGKNSPAIEPTAVPPTRQIIHIHVLWRPQRGTRSDNPSATNAAIDWYILGMGSERNQDILQYQGAGFVTIRGSGKTRTVTLRNTTLRPTLAAGDMTDYLGRTTIEGTLTCTLDNGRVESIVNDTRKSAAAVQQADVR